MNRTVMAILLSLFVITSVAHANCGNGSGNGNGCGDDQGSQGPTGPQGPAGQNGTNGTNGSNGSNGSNGANGAQGPQGPAGKDTSAQFRGTDLAADVAVRLLDAKYLQLQAFDTYVFGSTPGSDIFGNGRNQTIGARVVIKLGSSYEERLLEKQDAKIKALEAALVRLSK